MPLLSLDDAVFQLIRRAVPVLFCDTCALLDLIRVPYRGAVATSEQVLNAANSILTEVKSGGLSLVAPPPVSIEWKHNADAVRLEAESHIRKLRTHYAVLSSVMNCRGGELPTVNIKESDIATDLYSFSEKLLQEAINIERDVTLASIAQDRAIERVAPGKQGGGHQDCLLYEHTLQIMSKLRDQGFVKPQVLLTSNTNDFCENGANKEPIKTELLRVNSTLCTTWNWALSELTKS